MTGIYKITSPSGKVYIGQSVNIEQRIKKHINCIYKYDYALYRSLRKYGIEQHKIETVLELSENISVNWLNYWEQFFIDFYRGAGCELMNMINANGKGNHTTETKEKLSKSIKSAWKDPVKRFNFLKNSTRRVKVNQYSLNGELVRVWNSITEAACSLNVKVCHISSCCKGKKKSIGGYLWSYLDEIPREYFVDKGEKAIKQYDSSYNFIRVWPSARQAYFSTGITQQNIVACLKNRRNLAGGYIWKYLING